MKDLFISFIIFPIIWELYAFFNAKKYEEFYTGYLVKVNLKIPLNNNENLYTLLMFCYIVWVTIGLFTEQWFYFLLITFLSFMPRKRYEIILLDSLLTLIILILIFLDANIFTC